MNAFFAEKVTRLLKEIDGGSDIVSAKEPHEVLEALSNEGSVDTEGEFQDDALTGLDADGDGQVTITEVLNGLVDFPNVDLKQDEIAALAKEKAILEEKLYAVFNQIDGGDGIVSPEELDRLIKGLSNEGSVDTEGELQDDALKEMDADGDGQATITQGTDEGAGIAEEKAFSVDTEGEIQDDALKGMDADSDGQVTVTEVLNALVDIPEHGTDEGFALAKEKAVLEVKLRDSFKQIDDGDNIVSAEELNRLIAALSEQYEVSPNSEL
eukprot:TRINITY_DN403_c0_g2_i3.p1 TRINITY_DN403_c0_g2~~TRINITY_DN403_c0_g2_i3.p1  ORF type:complete len:300 (+),score=82.53 TRINITY_DN403_c0_g2_i3:99-902(+)